MALFGAGDLRSRRKVAVRRSWRRQSSWTLWAGIKGFLPAGRFGCALGGLAFPCFHGGPFSGMLAFPCFHGGLLALPLCGAALTFFAAAKKVSKESGLTPPAHKRVPWLGGSSGTSGIRAVAHSALVTKPSLAPTPHCLRRGRVCKGNLQVLLCAMGFRSSQGAGNKARPGRAAREKSEWVKLPRGAAALRNAQANERPAVLELPRRRAKRRRKNDCLVTYVGCAGGRIPDAPLSPPSQGTRLRAGGVSPLSLLTFFAAAKKVSAAPHRGNANRPP